MGNNPYFKLHDESTDEYDLFNQMVDEICETFGINFKFLPRKFQNQDFIFGEDVGSYFDEAHDLSLFLEDTERYSGSGDLFQKFGLQIDDNMTLFIQQDRFMDIVKEKPEISDLLYFPMTNTLFEITYVEDEEGFYQFGKQMMYKFSCKLYEYTGEEMTTGISEVDGLNDITDTNTTDESDQYDSEEANVIDFSETNIFGNK